MRGADRRPGSLFGYVDLERRVPSDHPLALIRTVVDDARQELSPSFLEISSDRGRSSVPPERFLGALLPQSLQGLRCRAGEKAERFFHPRDLLPGHYHLPPAIGCGGVPPISPVQNVPHLSGRSASRGVARRREPGTPARIFSRPKPRT